MKSLAPAVLLACLMPVIATEELSAYTTIHRDGFETGGISSWSACSGCLVFADGLDTGTPDHWTKVSGYIPPPPYYRLTSAQWVLGRLVVHGEGNIPEYIAAYGYTDNPRHLSMSCATVTIAETVSGWYAELHGCSLTSPMMVYGWVTHNGIPHCEGGAVPSATNEMPPERWWPRLW